MCLHLAHVVRLAHVSKPNLKMNDKGKKMIGWKVAIEIDGKEVVCEVVGNLHSDYGNMWLPVYYNNEIRIESFEYDQVIKVIERN
jgi:hypothetical protein